jgi:hypothetical protein
LDFLRLPKSSNRIMALESTQPPTEMSARNLPGVKEQPMLNANNLTPTMI